ncbi:Beta-hexosaminidase, partial [Operophtera brumata]
EIRINGTTIVDYPQYKHRGLLIDTGRHYLALSTIYKLVDALAMNKMNVLHWHLMDDQSFPYQSERFPALSEKGAYFPTMVYTRADIRSVVAFARDRGIRVVPEIDVPGHTRSWGEAFPHLLTECYQSGEVVGLGPLDPTRNTTYALLEQLFQEVHEWFPDEFLHVGGDEVQTACWSSNPHIREYLKKKNITVNYLQRDFMRSTLPLLPKQTRPIVWQEAFDMNAIFEPKTHVQVLKAGHYVIFSSSWYLDYHNMPWEEFYRADPRQMVYNMRKKKSAGLEDIVGGEACMWGELADDSNILSKRIEEHACRMNRRGIPAQPPNGPGFCIGAPPPLQKTYEVHNV